MKKTKMTLVSAAALLMLATMFQSAKPDEVMTKQDGMYVVNTTTLGKKVTGYVGATPLKVYIQKNKVVKIEALKNQETPKFFAKVKREMLSKWNGMKVNDALNAKVDGVTGATFSSEAVKNNVRLALEYYKKNK
ncbi:FMN-binding protein [Xylanibacter brevis]|uniref:FMN-binding protein n=1 Tax=Xylanibacter brevis TaxID=83231 RepID=UPI0004872AA2|nr:FMN-binding protein [Xylanibacter brevis]